MRRLHLFFAVFCSLLLGSLHSAASAPVQENAPTEQQLLKHIEAINMKSGLIVHAGCGGGTLTGRLGAGDRCVVQGLAADRAAVEKARGYIRSLGCYGRIAITHWNGKLLPYTDNMVNLLVMHTPQPHLEKGEIERVLAPRGVAIVSKKQEGAGLRGDTLSGDWMSYRKPVPEELDEWSHYLHSADNNAVSHDTQVGPPQQMQWVCGPRYARSHEFNSSMAAMVTSGGKLFYIWDEGPIGVPDKRFPPKWFLIARDAFNGTLAWKRPMPEWGWRTWHTASRWEDPRERPLMLRNLPATLPRRLVASGKHLYVTPGYSAPVSRLDAATGEILQTFKETGGTEEILYDNGVLFLNIRAPGTPDPNDVWGRMAEKSRGSVMAVDAKNGKVLWRSKPDDLAPLTLAVRNGRVFYSSYSEVVCLDFKTGRELWRSKPLESGRGHRNTCGTLVAQDDVVLYANKPRGGGSGHLHAYGAQAGNLLWTGPKYVGPGVTNPPDLFVASDLLWLGETRLPVDIWETNMVRKGYNPRTGDVVRTVSVPMLTSPGHHYRCYRSKATDRYLMLPKRGVEFLDLTGSNHMRHDWLRAPCIYGVLPANGILYTAPHQCVCYQGVLLSNFNALTTKLAASGKGHTKHANPHRLIKGSAYGTITGKETASESSGQWPMYRHDPQRTGGTKTRIPAKGLKQKWSVQLKGALTPPVAAGGKVLAAEKESHTVYAFDAEDGKVSWSYTTGAPVDSPPALHGGLVIFGSTDGWVYCLRLADGAECWRFQAAPEDRRIGAFGRVASAWPVHGAVIVQNDVTTDPPKPVVYFTAGRSTFLDGGIHAYGLDPFTGKLLYKTRLQGPVPDPFKDKGGAGYMDGAKSDILVSDGADLYLLQERFRSDLKRFPSPMQEMKKEYGGYRVYPAYPDRGSSGKHLISTRGFLDPTYNEGTFWTYGNRWPGWDRKMGRVNAYGQLLVFDRDKLYGVHMLTDNFRVRRGFVPGKKGSRLFARNLDAPKGQKHDTWSCFVPIRIRAMVRAGDTLFIAGPPDVVPEDDPLAAFEGRRGALLQAHNASNGKQVSGVYKLKAPPVYDGMIAAGGCLYVSTRGGALICLSSSSSRPDG